MAQSGGGRKVLARQGSSRPSPQNSSLAKYFVFILLAFSIVTTVFLNGLHFSTFDHALHLQASRDAFLSVALNRDKNKATVSTNTDIAAGKEQTTAEEPAAVTEGEGSSQHQLAGLSCDAYGGPSDEIAQEMVYWEDIPSDNKYVSPFKQEGQPPKYMTFEPDGGGWNNVRMAMETVLAMAYAMGRTLVLPPEKQMYLIAEGQKKQRTAFSFAHFFHMESIANEHVGVQIITMEEFLQREAMTGHVVNPITGQVTFPPNNRTNFDGDGPAIKSLNLWLREAMHMTIWNPETCMAAFPTKPGPEHVETLKAIKKDVEDHGGFPAYQAYVGKPHPVDASATDRMKENWAGRKWLCLYDEKMQKAPVVHFPHSHEIPGARLLVHFYAFLYFEDWRQDLWMKRFVRDHVRYIDEIQCAAARVVHAIRERAKSRQPDTNKEGLFDSFHVRRGDFQYTVTRFDADKIYNMSKEELTENATVYIATDERDKSFFKPLADHYDVVFLDDFKDAIGELNTNYYGMVDQLVASRGRIFFGCWFSTFTGYINRLRGYHADKLETPGYEDGIVPSYYYALEDRKFHMQQFWPVKQMFYAREFPASWRGIDKGIGELS